MSFQLIKHDMYYNILQTAVLQNKCCFRPAVPSGAKMLKRKQYLTAKHGAEDYNFAWEQGKKNPNWKYTKQLVRKEQEHDCFKYLIKVYPYKCYDNAIEI